jgi:hypothetical protein
MQASQNIYLDIRQILLQIFERDVAWKILPSNTGRDIPFTEFGLFEMEREKERGRKGRDKEDNGERKRAKVERVEKVDLEKGTTPVTTPLSKTLPASTATRRTTTQCLALSHSLWKPERNFGSTRKREGTKKGKREKKRERTREKDQGEKGKQAA